MTVPSSLCRRPRPPWTVGLVGALCWSLPALATVPVDPYPGCGEQDRYDLCPSEFDGDWNLISYIPEGSRETVREAELELGSGVHADTAWASTTGNWSVVLAVGDSGVDWHDLDTLNKLWLNTAELPLPWDADGQECPDWDCDGNGLANIQDWANDARVDPTIGQDDADALIDPSDLIYTFSDGVDDDENGFVDDICGWDFFGRDNDPYSDRRDEYGTHAGGVLSEAAAEAEDGRGDLGVCLNCALLPVRLSDSIVSDGVRVAEGIAFAVDSGAQAISLAHGALTHSELNESVVRYAWDMGTLVAGVAGDFNTFHNFFPAVTNGALYLRSLRSDSGNEGGDVYSYMNSWGCNNYGPRLDLVAPSNACATGAAAMTLGSIGLVASAGEQHGYDLSAGELVQLLVGTTDDVWLSDEERELAKAYPSKEGWDAFTGYGRVNVARAVERVSDGEIPPVAAIWGPTWFDTYDLAQTAEIDIVAQVSADRTSGYEWVLEYGTGLDPVTWTAFGDGSGTSAYEGALAALDLTQVDWLDVGEPETSETTVERVERAFGPSVTVRLTVTDAEGRDATSRLTFFVQEDPDRHEGFPVDLGGSLESSPALADFDGDGIFEIVVANGNGEVWVIDGSGSPLPGWPVQTDAHPYAHDQSPAIRDGALPEGLADAIIAGVAVADLDGDGSPEVVAASIMGALYAWHDDGQPVDGFPYRILGRALEDIDDAHRWENSIWGSPVLEDLDLDGTHEVIFAALDGRLYVVDHRGEDWGDYPIEVCHPDLCADHGSRIVTSPAVGDVDDDGDLDVALGTAETATGNSLAYLYDLNTGALHEGWPVEARGLISADNFYLPVVGEGHPASLSLADVDGDGDLELANSAFLGQEGLIHHDGTSALSMGFAMDRYGSDSNANEGGFVQIASVPSFGDMDGDDVPDLIQGGSGTMWFMGMVVNTYVDFQHLVGGWSGATGDSLAGWPRQIEDWQLFTSAAIADLDGDGKAEAIHGSAGYVLHAWNSDGDSPDGWPKFTGQWLLASPAVGDVDGDGYLEVVVGSREGFLWVWNTLGPADGTIEWPSARHDVRNTGNYEVALPSQAGPPAEEISGCCQKRRARRGEAWVWLPVLFGVIGRRREGWLGHRGV
ncbi:MAG: FG-GAP-like repeat-containing protein [Myxococcota bacterium]|nr:FG-GAP-like repeat-containing protein [Myxococcota bacterium]